MPDKLAKLEQIVKMLDEGVTKEDFVKAFEKVLSFVVQNEQSNKKTRAALQQAHDSMIANIQSQSQSSLADLKQQITQIITQFIDKNSTQLLSTVDKRIAQSKVGLVDEARLGEAISNIQIPTIEELKADLPKLGAPIRDALELLEGDERLDKSAIKGLKEEFDRLIKLIQKAPTMLVGGVSGKGHIKPYDLSSKLNGVLKTFNLPTNWTIISVHSASSPIIFRPTTDYTFTPTTITFTSQVDAGTTLAAGQSVIVVYEEA